MRIAIYLIAASVFLVQATMVNASPIPVPILTFDWSYTDGGSNTGSGTLTAIAGATTGVYDLQSISGTADGYSINSITTVFSSPDQLVYYGNGQPFVDTNGISFVGPDNKAFNLEADNAAGGNPFAGFSCNGAYCLVGPGSPTDPNASNINPLGGTNYPIVPVDVTLTLASAAPEPSTWAMMLLGFAGIGFMVFRGKKKRALLAA